MLFVEDDDLSVKVMKRIFQTDFEMFICDSAEEFHENYSKNIFNIIIVDISLNGAKTGLELIKEIKEIPSFTDTPILCLTAHAQTKMQESAIQSGADYFITRPVSNKLLREAVDFLLKPK